MRLQVVNIFIIVEVSFVDKRGVSYVLLTAKIRLLENLNISVQIRPFLLPFIYPADSVSHTHARTHTHMHKHTHIHIHVCRTHTHTHTQQPLHLLL